MSLQVRNLQGGEVQLLLRTAVVQHSVQRVPRVRGSRRHPMYHAVQASPTKWPPLSGHTSFVSLPHACLFITNQLL